MNESLVNKFFRFWVYGCITIFIIDKFILWQVSYKIEWNAWLHWTVTVLCPILIIGYLAGLKSGAGLAVFGFGFGWGYSDAQSKGKGGAESVKSGFESGIILIIAIPLLIIYLGPVALKHSVFDRIVYFKFSDPYDVVVCKDCTEPRDVFFHNLDVGEDFKTSTARGSLVGDGGERYRFQMEVPKIANSIDMQQYDEFHINRTFGFSAMVKHKSASDEYVDIDIFSNSTGGLLRSLHLKDGIPGYFLSVTYGTGKVDIFYVTRSYNVTHLRGYKLYRIENKPIKNKLVGNI